MIKIVHKCYTFSKILINASKQVKTNFNNFGIKLTLIKFWDDIQVPNKKPNYIRNIENYVDDFFKDFIVPYETMTFTPNQILLDKFPIWLCWWQGIENMPEIVRMCFERLKTMIPSNAELHVLTVENYLEYVDMPDYIIDKFNKKIITMATMSDILRMTLLSKYGGYWLDATIFFTDNIPNEYFTRDFYCQKMYDPIQYQREACKGRWCGFSMAGRNDNVLFHFMRDGFFEWWKKYNAIPDYVLIDYMILIAYKRIPNVKSCIDSVENNNEDIFEMYKHLNEPYSDELYQRLTKRNVMHKLTYKMDLRHLTPDGKETLYGHLYKEVFGDNYGK